MALGNRGMTLEAARQCAKDRKEWRALVHMWSEVVAVGQNLRSISSQAGLKLLNVLVTLTLSHRSFNYDTGHMRVWMTLGDWHCGLETFMLGSRSEPMQSNITASSTDQSANHLYYRGDNIYVLCIKDNRHKYCASRLWDIKIVCRGYQA